MPNQNNIFERYNRNILIKEISEDGQKKLLNSKVLVAGAGGLGSTVLANLTAAGIGTIGVIDCDDVELSNLNRQYIHKFFSVGMSKVESAKNFINELNPNTKVKTYQLKLSNDNYQEITPDYDLIIDCFDSFESKFLLNEIAVKTSKILIHGGITEFYGQVTVINPTKTACLRCILDEENPEISKGAISPAISTIASIQSMEAIKCLLKIGKTLENKLLSYDGLNMQFKTINIAKNPNCKLCS